MESKANLSVKSFQHNAIALTCYKILLQIEEGASMQEVEKYVRYLGEKSLRKMFEKDEDDTDLLL
jgi:hypothetical protein